MRLPHQRRPQVRFAPMVMLVAAALAIIAAPPRAFAVTRTCGPNALANTASVLCTSGSCTATLVRVTTAIDVTAGGCNFDVGGRAVSFEKAFDMIGTGYIRVLNAGNVTITSTGRLRARGDYVTNSGTIIGGGFIALTSSGTIDISGFIDVSGDAAGSIQLIATQDVLLRQDALLNGQGISSFSDAGDRFSDGGSLDVTARTGSITFNGDVRLSGQNGGTGGIVDLTAGRDVTISHGLDISGGASGGGEMDVTAGDNISIVSGALVADSTFGGGSGGIVSLDAGEDFLGGVVLGGGIDINGVSVLLRGSAAETYGGDGGELDLLATGRIRLSGVGMVIRADAASNFDGSGGVISFDSGDNNISGLGPLDGDLEIGGLVSMTSGGTGGYGGTFDVSAGRDLVLTASVSVSGTDTGGDVTGTAGRAITLNGVITTKGLSATGEGGFVDFESGLASDLNGLGNLTVMQDIDGSSGIDYGSGQSISLTGCGLTISPGVKINGTGGVNPNNSNLRGGSDIELIALRPMQLGGNSQYVAPPGGSVTTTHPPGATPVIASSAVFNPARVDNAIVNGPYPNCPVCGDGFRQYGEGCDDANLAAGDGCSPTCSVEPGWSCGGTTSVCVPLCGDGLIIAGEQCDDHNLASGDGCTPVCTVETGWTCSGQPSTCSQVQICGDGFKTTSEQCDDGNLTNGDGCDANCTVTGCGNGIVTAGEDCEDGNTSNGDCCSASCTFETSGSLCASDGNPCRDDVCNGAGACTHPPNTAPCNDGNGCTQTDTCQGGACVGSNPLVCTALDTCHTPGTCTPATGTCSNPVRSNGSTCSDGNACTRTDSCQSGVCTGTNPVICTALDQCHVPGTCDGGSGTCSNPTKPDNTTCNDTNRCTLNDTCQVGVCGGAPVVCTALDQCHVAGTCSTATGLCSNPTASNGTSCDDGNVCTRADLCTAGTCGGDPHVCGDGVIEGTCGEVCDDGNLVDGDGCDANCTPTTCGNGIVTTGEACDDGDVTDGDGCTATCTVEPGWGCTGSPSSCREICGDGIRTPGEACDDGNVVDRDGCSSTCTFELCSAVPVEGCRLPIEPQRASLALKDKLGTEKDALTWKWTRGASTTRTDFGNPRFNTDYALCIYDEKAGTVALKVNLPVPHAGFCKGQPCWKSTNSGYTYSNAAVVPDGKFKILLKEGPVAGTAKISVTGKGTNLRMPTLPLDQDHRVRVQIKNSTGLCWEGIYSTSKSNEPSQFNAKSD